jgi:cation diffusion facilitator family transporter
MNENNDTYKLLRDDMNSHLNATNKNVQAPKFNDMNEKAKRKLILVCCVCSLFMLIEFIGGLLANSLAIMTDAAHLLSDLGGFIISIFAIYISKFPPTNKFTYGFHRAEIVGAIASVFLIWILTTLLLIESLSRIIQSLVSDIHHNVNGGFMLLTSSVGLVFNMIMAYILHYSDVKLNKYLIGITCRM